MSFKYVKSDVVMSDEKEMIRLLDIDGNLIDKNYKPESTKEILEMYKNMVRSRQWDLYALNLQKTGRIGTFAPNLGEEAFLSALGAVVRKDDWFVPHYRVLATLLTLGIPMKDYFKYWKGSEQGAKSPDGVNVMPMQVVIGSQISQAAGVAYAQKLQGKDTIALTTIGNGGTNEGEFHEGLNFASVRNLPLLCAIANNQWAISVPQHNSYKVKTLSQRAASYGIPGLRVDGNDLLASYEVAKEAVKYIREGNGPVLIEFVTWRQGQHTTSDNPRVYRSAEMEQEKEKWEPMHRIEKYLLDTKLLTEETKAQIWADAEAEAKQAFVDAGQELEGKESYEDIFKWTYAEMTEELKEQLEEGKKYQK
ncbi:pyruvate dehydrogenase (acetyl-transferring) E1 component subunit alpha [Mycoplasma phocoenae]|uniref:Pyruvate dehydrogenase E1 component subunit alpha n=1 Tax=Mycoplasma phocoenae TaxID=754517 RepID=A0A858U176_9MOLU|nr:pyruvate dehydrogenase (acetyl-transferring) E1 component subunit alpha [Mycoplasma phocoenae]QJG66864.1 pyruvate dehydrogenase (acetyl-transferring) E1 component subunit alpha [Mycoplasma phocoenae]